MKLSEAKLGDFIECYVDIRKNKTAQITAHHKNNTIKVVVIGLYNGLYNPADNSNGIPHSLLIGWDNSVVLDYQIVGADYHYASVNGGMARLERNIGGAPGYRFVHNLSDFTSGKWVHGIDNFDIDKISNHPFDGKIIAPCFGPIKFIKSNDIRVGDTIAWLDRGAMNYICVNDISEGEQGYDGNPALVLDGQVFCNEGLRSYPEGYSMPIDTTVMLINRSK